MASGSSGTALATHLDILAKVGGVGAMTDGQLLDRFAVGEGGEAEAAFAALVERHGPMVLRACRAALGDPHAAQDAFQATFLVLVRRAGSIRRRESVAGWLFGVARRVARRVGVDAARRRRLERRGAASATEAGPKGVEESWPELHEEIARLPEKYRQPV